MLSYCFSLVYPTDTIFSVCLNVPTEWVHTGALEGPTHQCGGTQGSSTTPPWQPHSSPVSHVHKVSRVGSSRTEAPKIYWEQPKKGKEYKLDSVAYYEELEVHGRM